MIPLDAEVWIFPEDWINGKATMVRKSDWTEEATEKHPFVKACLKHCHKVFYCTGAAIWCDFNERRSGINKIGPVRMIEALMKWTIFNIDAVVATLRTFIVS